jgi:hypothetical protein
MFLARLLLSSWTGRVMATYLVNNMQLVRDEGMLRQWSIGRRLSLVTLMVLALLGLLLFFCLQIYQQGLMGEKSRQTRA